MNHLKKFSDSDSDQTSDIKMGLMKIFDLIESEYEMVRSDISHYGESRWVIEFDKYPEEKRKEIVHKISVGLEEIIEDFKCVLEIGYFIEDWKWITKKLNSINDLIRLNTSNKLVTKLDIILK